MPYAARETGSRRMDASSIFGLLIRRLRSWSDSGTSHAQSALLPSRPRDISAMRRRIAP